MHGKCSDHGKMPCCGGLPHVLRIHRRVEHLWLQQILPDEELTHGAGTDRVRMSTANLLCLHTHV